ncbi:PREDICTED: endogenous retrovirus group K member 5 Gag polyprotein-like [Condylura cristata]|uniref:endogenous retrovirus group K member 5 Gag polyprotein-like n=1 Tax=Condylura cristata TaxID=143302 RepID=UPI0006435BE6|nr:PREDICTED: endogenous retrovirus group K member 5 Gag polyprotein-like [Condylura cristata]
MGQELSQHELYVSQLKDTLQSRGINVKTKDLLRFFDFIKETCPWFPLEGTIDYKRWLRMGDALNDYFRTFSPEKIPVTAFSYWNLIREILSTDNDCPKLQNTIAQTEAILRSRPGTLAAVESECLAQKTQSKIQTDLISFPSDKNEPSQDTDPDKINPTLKTMPLLPNTTLKIYPPLPLPDSPDKPNNQGVLYTPQDPDPSGVHWDKLATQAARCNPTSSLSLAAVAANLTRPSGPSRPPSLDKQPPSTELKSQLVQLKNCIHNLTLQRSQSTPPSLSAACAPAIFPSAPTAAVLSPPPPYTLPLQAFPVIQITNDQSQVIRHHQPHNFRFLKELKEAVSQYGACAPFTLTIVDSLGDNWLTPSDWHSLVKATLSTGDHLLWQTEFYELCKEFSLVNQRNNSPWTLEMLTGMGPYLDPQVQISYDPGLFIQISAAATHAWRRLPVTSGQQAPLTSIRQGPSEPFQDFVAHLQTAAERSLGSSDTTQHLIRQLAFENASPTCQAAIRPIKRQATSITDFIRACADIIPAYEQGLAMAAAFSGQSVTQFIQAKNTQQMTCFKCHQPCHFANHCPQGLQTQALNAPTKTPPTHRPSKPCPRCRKGYHWARDCRSTTDVEGKPLPPHLSDPNVSHSSSPQPGNARRCQLPAPKITTGAFTAGWPQTVPPTHPFQTSQGPPQAAQDWTSVPPPTQY